MATEDFCLNLSPLPSPRWSPPWPFVPSSNSNYSMVMQYHGCNQSMDNHPPQNQEHGDIVDPPLYMAGDSALLQQQQQLHKNWSEASDWRPRGGVIMGMNMLELQSNNQGFEESNMGFYFPPSTTNFPLYRPMPTVFFVSSNIQDISLAVSCQHILEDKSGALHVINGVERHDILELLFRGFGSYLENKFGDFNQIARAAGVLPKGLQPLVDNTRAANNDEMTEVTLRRINWLEQHDERSVDQPVFEMATVVYQLIQNRDGELDVILGGRVFTINGQEWSDGHGLRMTPETLLICQAKLSIRVWLEHGGQWTAEHRRRCNRLNIGSFTTIEDSISAYEAVMRWSGWEDPTSFSGHFENENRSKLSLQLPLPAFKGKPNEDFGLVCCNATGNDEIESVGTGDCIMAHQTRLNSKCSGKRKTKEKNLGGGRRNKKTNGVRIAISFDDILQTKGMRIKDAANHLEVSRSTFKRACREYGIERWPPCKERELISQSHSNESPAVVDQERIPQLNSDTLLPFTQVSAMIGTNIVTIMARYGEVRIKVQLSWPWRMVELEQQVKKRLPLEAGTYYINYKDEDDGLMTLIACDEDLEDYISSSSRLGTHPIEVFLEPKVAHELCVNQL